MQSRRELIRVLALTAATLVAGRARGAQTVDPRIQENPALGRVYEKDPRAASRIMKELDQILRTSPPTQRSFGRVEDQTTRDLLRENPLLEQAYRIDPKIALQQIKEI